MTREELEKLRDAIASVAYDDLEGPVANQDYARQVQQWEQCKRIADAQLAAIEAAGVRLVYSGEAPAQLIDGDERTTVRIFTPYAPPSPGEITGMRKAEVPCSDCIDGWCQMNCGPRVG